MMAIAGGVITWACGIGITLVTGDDIATHQKNKQKLMNTSGTLTSTPTLSKQKKTLGNQGFLIVYI
jgi:hypothetical protein